MAIFPWGGGGGRASHVLTTTGALHPQTEDPSVALQQMIMSRLRVNPYEWVPFEFLYAHQVSPDKFIVFVIQDGQPVTLTDDALFPSDGLITQLRLLMKGDGSE